VRYHFFVPAKPNYFHRLSDALALIQQLDSELVDRRTVEELLGVSKTVAWRIMRRCGAQEGPGNTLICLRKDLAAALQRLQATGEFEREERRRNRLTTYLQRLAEMGLSRRTTVATQSQAWALIHSRFQNLPAGISLTPKNLTIEFTSADEFLQRIGAVIFALQNDYESIREFIEGGVRSR
jgi:hypothetical protein